MNESQAVMTFVSEVQSQSLIMLCWYLATVWFNVSSYNSKQVEHFRMPKNKN